jgi:ATP-dependent Lhr-like helicase
MDRTRDVLDQFHPAVAAWFREQFGAPTPPQRLGWPAIASGQNTLIVAPTGSGKTLAAFLAALDHLWKTHRAARQVGILYVSPLKALNADVSRNLQVPLEGILARSHDLAAPLPSLRAAVRSGDTTRSERAAQIRKPPDILITTPESLHLLLTSRARDILRSISHVIVDEIHAVCGNKRGVFLALLLERLEAINLGGFVRIGLSATQRPLDEVARYLGGLRRLDGADSGPRFAPRPITIVDTGWRRELDLEVIWPGRLDPAPGSIWPEIERELLSMVRAHRSTLIFANNRRTVEKLTARLNDLAGADGDDLDLGDDDAGRSPGIASAAGDSSRPFRAHHGSISIEERRETEEALKRGEVPAVVATASLELGIDMGAVDLVCQVESPGSVARGLQRVGRAGHVVSGVSKGRLIAKTPGDLLESAALAQAMQNGQIEHLRVPRGCLDVLAQQLIACVAIEPWEVPALFDMVRGAYPYCNLTAEAFESVLCLISGRFPNPSFRDLRARVAWDRVHNRLAALPGTAQLALVGGGTIPDTGQFAVYLGNGGPRLGELDEEFVYERRVGETFVLGNATWRIEAIDADRVTVCRAEGQAAVMPFWRGEGTARSRELGAAMGALLRELTERDGDPELVPWLARECRLTRAAAAHLLGYIARQRRVAGAVPDDRTVLVESFLDPTGELGVAILTPFGGRLHQALKLAVCGRIRDRFGLSPACLHGDLGLLVRLPNMEEPPLDLLEGLTGEAAECLIRAELPETPLFGLRFRQNAARALLMPRPDPAKRTPLWLQRLRAKDLLQVARRFPDFPIVVETLRECLDDDLDVARLRSFLDAVSDGSIRVVKRRGEIPSPFVSELIFRFTMAYMYEWDEPRTGDRKPAGPGVDLDLLEPLLRASAPDNLLDPQAIARLDGRLRRLGKPPRTVDEMAEHLRLCGDLAPSEVAAPSHALLEELRAAGRALAIELPGTSEPTRWISSEEQELYLAAFPRGADDGPPELSRLRLRAEAANSALVPGDEAATSKIVFRFLQTHALIGLADLLARYPISSAHASDLLEKWCEQGQVVRLAAAAAQTEPRWVQRDNLLEMRRATVAVRRRESVAVAPEVFADFLLRRQHVHPETRGRGARFLEAVLKQLQGSPAPARLWENDILPRRVEDYRPSWLDEIVGRGGLLWRARPQADVDDPGVSFYLPDYWAAAGIEPATDGLSGDEAQIAGILGRRGASFAVDVARLAGIEPSRARLALNSLTAKGLVTNDRFEPLRAGAQAALAALTQAADLRRSGGSGPRQTPRSLVSHPEGRWSLLEVAPTDPELRLRCWADVLLDRYGVLAREIVALEQLAPAWSDLAGFLCRAEWRGELRRGYFVEGLSGVQYATEDAVRDLALLPTAPDAAAPFVHLSTRDPANLYGSGAPLDVELLGGGAARLPRLPGNSLVLRFGRPVLIIEGYGKRLTGLPWAARDDIESALNFLPTLTNPDRRILKVESYNGSVVTDTFVAARLAEIGFVRDYPALAYYRGWPAAPLTTQTP